MAGMIWAWITAERITDESAENGDAEERGWVDPRWSMTEVFPSRNNAKPIVDASADDIDLPAECISALEEYLGSWEDTGDGSTFTGSDCACSLESGDCWHYSVHFVHKYYDGFIGQYVEKDYAPFTELVHCMHGGHTDTGNGHSLQLDCLEPKLVNGVDYNG